MEITSDNDDDEDFDTSSANDSELKMVLVVNNGMILYLTTSLSSTIRMIQEYSPPLRLP